MGQCCGCLMPQSVSTWTIHDFVFQWLSVLMEQTILLVEKHRPVTSCWQAIPYKIQILSYIAEVHCAINGI